MADDVREMLADEDYKKQYGFSTDTDYVDFPKGLSEEVVRRISKLKGEPEWMLQKRLLSYKVFTEKPVPFWGADLSGIDFDDIYYYKMPKSKQGKKWEDVPAEIKDTFEKLGVPEAERKFFAGEEAQLDSGVVYSSVKKALDDLGVIFTDTDTAVKKYPDLLKKYFGTIIPLTDNKFASLNTAVWSGGSFIYVPKGVKVPMPLNAYFRINAERMGQFERTLIVADEGSEVTYIEGCFTAGTPITTIEGTKKIEEISVGDKVLTHNGNFKSVYHTQARKHTGKLLTLELCGDTASRIDVTDEHPFLSSKRERQEYTNIRWNTEWIRACELRKGDYLAIPIDKHTLSKEERKFTVKFGKGTKTIQLKTDKDFFRLIGYYLSEGSVLPGDHYLCFTFNKNEKNFVLDTALLLEKYFGKEPIIQKEYKNGIGMTLCSTVAARFFATQFNKGAKNKALPEWAFHEDPEKQKELVKGFWRGDGSFMYVKYPYGTKRMFRINTISPVLSSQMKSVLLRLDIFASLNKSIRGGKRNDMYTLYIGGNQLVNFANIVDFNSTYAIETGITLMMKKMSTECVTQFAKIVGNYAFVPIKNILTKEVESYPVYNFSVEEEESYVANGIAVHNCTAPIYTSNSLHAAVVEVVAHKNSHIRYITIQNWAKNIYNLTTQRAYVEENAHMEWIDTNIGSKVNMKYPSVYLRGRHAKGEILSIALASEGQNQDSGGKAYHLAPDTVSRIVSKSISKGTGLATFRSLIHIGNKAENSKSNTICNALLMDDKARTNTFPYVDVQRNDSMVSHEAKVGKISEEEVFYLMSRGISESDAIAMIILGFLKDFKEAVPLEYSLELKRLIKLNMAGSVG